MVVELRKIGRRWALYTNDEMVYKHLGKCTIAANKVPYIQNGKLVGIDFYFNEKLNRTIRKVAKGQMFLGI